MYSLVGPSVTILVAIYKPNIKWFIEQIKSLNKQTYKNIQIYIWNDCPNDCFDYTSLIDKFLTNFNYLYYKGKINLGSNGAFEKLTKLANTKYVAYCDQDDIWLPNKIELLIDKANRTNSDLLCSDMYVIDEYGNIVSDSITKVRKRHTFDIKCDYFKYQLTRKFVTGCTTLVKTEFAKKALPFPKEFVHDWWLGICAAAFGKICIIKQPLIQYRIHNSNQTSFLSKIVDKHSYYEYRIKPLKKRAISIKEKFAISRYSSDVLDYCSFVEARISYFIHPSFINCFTLLKFLRMSSSIVVFESLIPLLPNSLFGLLIKILKNRLSSVKSLAHKL